MIKFCILGDMGSGEISQHNVAEAMYHNIVANKIKFVCGLGDNIYPAGCYNTDDPQFIEKFEKPYKMIPNNINFICVWVIMIMVVIGIKHLEIVQIIE